MSIYVKARGFMYRNARPLDMARWQYHFENGSRAAVLMALGSYQNADGGFGHALEADAWNPNSSPIQTWAATEILREMDYTRADHPIVQGILRYLAGGKDFNGHFWANTVPGNNDFPHAPWWHTQSESACHNDYNPTACLAGFIVRFADEGSALYETGVRIAGEAAARLLDGEEIADMHTISCFIRLTQYLEAAGRADIIDLHAVQGKLRAAVNRMITRDTSLWQNSYICRPSQFMNCADSPFYTGNEDMVRYECEFIGKTQTPDGSWDVTWSWADYPEQWAISKNWWKADIALKNLLFLRGFGKL